MSDYDDDILLWSERQAGLLRRRAAGELVNYAEIDWPNASIVVTSKVFDPLPSGTMML